MHKINKISKINMKKKFDGESVSDSFYLIGSMESNFVCVSPPETSLEKRCDSPATLSLPMFPISWNIRSRPPSDFQS